MSTTFSFEIGKREYTTLLSTKELNKLLKWYTTGTTPKSLPFLYSNGTPKVIFRFLRDAANQKCGCLVTYKKEGNLFFGISLCHFDEFDLVQAKKIALARLEKSMKVHVLESDSTESKFVKYGLTESKFVKYGLLQVHAKTGEYGWTNITSLGKASPEAKALLSYFYGKEWKKVKKARYHKDAHQCLAALSSTSVTITSDGRAFETPKY
jgi:hypothetical protein